MHQTLPIKEITGVEKDLVNKVFATFLSSRRQIVSET